MYKPLSKIYFKGEEAYNKEYVRRKQGVSSVSLNLDAGDYPMFFVYCSEIVNSINNILLLNSKVEKLYSLLPNVLEDTYSYETLIDEVMTTNDIEGIRSTRKEIIDALDDTAPEKGSVSHKKFKGLVKKYLLLLNVETESIKLASCKDVRALYDDIVLREIDGENRPDGETFRKDAAYVISGTQKQKHQGVTPEAKIVEYMTKALEILHSDEYPSLVRIAIMHYLIGYIHPFYDGNGRLSRFISSYMLRKDLNPLIALRLSYAIKESKKAYYKAFDICNHKRNLGDITPFILMFLERVAEAASQVYDQLADAVNALSHYRVCLQKLEEQDDDMMRVFWLIIQNQLFALERLDIKKMEPYLNFSYGKINQKIGKLIEKGVPIIKERKGRSYRYSIDMDDLDHYLEGYDSD